MNKVHYFQIFDKKNYELVSEIMCIVYLSNHIHTDTSFALKY